jgi:hypothetical protein
LLPFAILYTDLSEKSQKETLRKMGSKEYREKSFKLVLVGSDDVANAWNKMWSEVYKVETRNIEAKEILLSYGDVLFAIRRSLGHKKQ